MDQTEVAMVHQGGQPTDLVTIAQQQILATGRFPAPPNAGNYEGGPLSQVSSAASLLHHAA